MVIGRLRRRDDRGSFSLELALLAPIIMGLLWMMLSAGRVTQATSQVEGAARDGARAASINHAGRADDAAIDAVNNSLVANGVTCVGGPAIGFDPAGALQPGARIVVTVTCRVAILFGAGSVAVTRRGVSVLDTFRGVD